MSQTEAQLDERIAALIAEAQGLRIWDGLDTPGKDSVWKAMEWGRPLDFSLFMYGNYELFRKVTQTHPYSALYGAMREADQAMAPHAAGLFIERGLKDFYSSGPTGSVDKLILKKIVSEGLAVTYHPMDLNPEHIKATLDEVVQHLSATFDDGKWAQKVKFADTEPTDFGKVKSSRPSLVVYSGGTIMNNREFWQQAASLAQQGGIVVASTAITHPEPDMGKYWLSMYDTPEGRQMFEGALQQAFPELFTNGNRDRWYIEFEYVPMLPHFSKYEQYQTPRISVGLMVKKPMTLHFPDGTPIMLKPTPTWAEAAKWSWNEQRDRNFPIELAISTKPYLGDFMLATPEDFGMKNILYVPRQIAYESDGLRGMVAAAAFSVDKPTSNWHRMEKRGPPRGWDLALADRRQSAHRK